MTLYDIALARRRRWKEEGIEEGRKATQSQVDRARAEAREMLLREKINAVLADPTLTPEAKNHVIGILTADSPE